VVYDGVGADTFEASLNSLSRRGMLVSFGNASGPAPAIEPSRLARGGSLFLTRPSLAAHTATTAEYQDRAKDVLSAVAAGIITPRIWRHYPLADARLAHADLENGRSSGTIILTP